jgi:hypothetical protein
MRRETAVEIGRLLASFPHEPPDADSVRARADRYVDECGCAAGGIFLIIVALATPVALFVSHSWSLPAILWFLFAVVTAPMVGKLTGIAFAILRLQSLRRQLQRRVLAVEVANVHLH